jgi:alkyldihydroxyacetonephosphate synthase
MQKIEEKYPESLKSKLENIFGAENVITDQSEMDCQKVDVWWITRYRMFQGKDIPQPYAIVFPENKEQIIELVNYCNIHKLPITPRGGGAGDSGGSIALKGGITVDTKRMDRILKIYDKSLTVRVQPGNI